MYHSFFTHNCACNPVNKAYNEISFYSYDACFVKLGFWEYSEPKTLIEPIPILREGNRRDPATWQPYSSLASVPSPLIDRGFTFHEHLYPFTLINMLSEVKSRSEALAGNGRAGVYPERCNRFGNPLTGRFLSADPYIQAPDNTQNLNRYSYCLNNPLKYSDPSGNEWWNPIDWFVDFMDWINNNTEDIRKQMVDADIPGFNVGFNTSFDGQNWEAYGGLDRGLNVSYNNEMGWGLGTSDRYTGDNRFYYPAYNYGAVEQNAMNDYYGTKEMFDRINNAFSFAGLTWGIGELSIYNECYFLGRNMKYYSTSWVYGNQWTGTSFEAQKIARMPKLMGRLAFSINIVYGGYNVFSGVRNRNYSKAAFSGLGTIYSGISTYGGVFGMTVAGPMAFVDATMGLDNYLRTIINDGIDRGDRISNGDYSLWAYPKFGQSYR